MFKNRNLKKFISIICTILTLNSTSSILQCNPKAIELVHSGNDDKKNYRINYNKPFYYIIIRYTDFDGEPQQIFNGSDPWTIAGVRSEGSKKNSAHVYTVTSRVYQNELWSLLEKMEVDAEIMLVFGLTYDNSRRPIPDLPFGMITCPEDAWGNLTKDQRQDVINSIGKLVPSTTHTRFTLAIDGQTGPKFMSWSVASPSKAIDVKAGDKELVDNMRADGRIITLAQLEDLLRINKPAGRTTENEPPLTAYRAGSEPALKPDDSSLPLQNTNRNEMLVEKPTNLHVKESYPLENIETHGKPAVSDPLVSEINPVRDPQPFDKKLTDGRLNADLLPAQTARETVQQNIHQKPQTCFPTLDAAPTQMPPNVLGPNGATDTSPTFQESAACSRPTTKFITRHPKTSAGLVAGAVALVATTAHSLKQLFTRKSQRSQPKHQTNHKYNDPAKNNI